jgi:hypothetical protein
VLNKTQRIEVLDWLKKNVDIVMDLLTHPTTRLTIEIIPCDGVPYPNLQITTKSAAAELVIEATGVGYSTKRERPHGEWFIFRGNVLVRLFYEAVGIEDPEACVDTFVRLFYEAVGIEDPEACVDTYRK